MSGRIRAVGLLVLFLALPLAAATTTELIPTSAPHGASFIVVGTGLDAPDVTARFVRTGGGTTFALIVSRAPQMIEGIVPDRKSTRLNSRHGYNSYAAF